MLIVFQPEHIVETATRLGRERRRRWRISAMQAGTTPKKRTSLNGRAALKLMRLDGARRADQAASDARVTKASSSIAVALLLISSGASATECQSSPGHDGKWWSYRIVDWSGMLVSGQAWPLQGPVAVGQAIAAASRDPPGPRRQPAPCTASPAAAAHRDRHTEGGLDRADPGADEQAACRRPRPRRLCPSRRHCQPSRRSRRSGGCCS